MTSTLKEHVFVALRKLLTPIVKMLLRNGVTYKEFACSVKTLCGGGLGGFWPARAPHECLQVSPAHGLDRKEVKRIKDLLENLQHGADAQINQDRFTRVLSAWHLDAEFIDDSGLPLTLPHDGESASFASLAKRFGGDVPLQALIKELVRAGAVRELPDNHYRAYSVISSRCTQTPMPFYGRVRSLMSWPIRCFITSTAAAPMVKNPPFWSAGPAIT